MAANLPARKELDFRMKLMVAVKCLRGAAPDCKTITRRHQKSRALLLMSQPGHLKQWTLVDRIHHNRCKEKLTTNHQVKRTITKQLEKSKAWQQERASLLNKGRQGTSKNSHTDLNPTASIFPNNQRKTLLQWVIRITASTKHHSHNTNPQLRSFTKQLHKAHFYIHNNRMHLFHSNQQLRSLNNNSPLRQLISINISHSNWDWWAACVQSKLWKRRTKRSQTKFYHWLLS